MSYMPCLHGHCPREDWKEARQRHKSDRIVEWAVRDAGETCRIIGLGQRKWSRHGQAAAVLLWLAKCQGGTHWQENTIEEIRRRANHFNWAYLFSVIWAWQIGTSATERKEEHLFGGFQWQIILYFWKCGRTELLHTWFLLRPRPEVLSFVDSYNIGSVRGS